MTYEDIAIRLRVRLCACSLLPGINANAHETGYAWSGRIHWRQRRVTKPGLRRFLKLIAVSQLGAGLLREPYKTFWACFLADGMARDLHVRFPRRYSELDRARVRSAMVGANLDRETRRLMERWIR